MHRGGDRSGDPPAPAAPGVGGRFSRGPSRWSSGGGGSPPHRFSRGGDGGGGGGGRFHPYRVPSEYGSGGGIGGGFRGGPGEFVEQPNAMAGPGPAPRRFGGRGQSPEHEGRTNYVKLFVGSVPRTAAEEDVRPLFEEHGDVLEVALIKDRKTGEQQGCCFVKYANAEEAERAIRALHNQYTLPGANGPIQVRYADGERERHGAIEHKLFVASLNKQATIKEIEDIFAQFGHVEDVYIMKDAMRQSRGCGFVKFSSREAAMAAMNSLSGSYVMRGCDQPLIVRFADPKRPRPGESRGGPTFGGPGFSPRSDATLVIRPTANLDEPRGRHMPPDSWHPPSPRSMGAPQFSNVGSENPLAPKGGAVTSSSDNVSAFRPALFPANGSLSSYSAAPSSSHMGINPSMAQGHSMGGQQISPLQRPPAPQQNFPPLQLQNAQQMPTPNAQGQLMQGHMQHIGQLQVPQSMGPGSFGQTLPSMQLPGQVPTSQPMMQSNPSVGPLQAPSAVQPNTMQPLPGQQQLTPSNVTSQLLQQPMQQMPSQAPHLLLQQQAQALHSSFQSSQQAIFQLQQQLQLMQQQQQQSNLNQQQPVQGHKQQPALSGQPVPSNTPGGAPAAVVPPNISAILQQITSPAVSLTCNWTEHTSPEGHKYYYNSISRESTWVKPEEYALYEQQQQLQQQKLLLLQQHQKLAIQQLQSSPQTQSLASMQPTQQLPSAQQGQAQLQIKQPAQMQLLQPSVPELNYTQLQAASSLDPSRIQEGIQAAQERAWKNKPAG